MRLPMWCAAAALGIACSLAVHLVRTKLVPSRAEVELCR